MIDRPRIQLVLHVVLIRIVVLRLRHLSALRIRPASGRLAVDRVELLFRARLTTEVWQRNSYRIAGVAYFWTGRFALDRRRRWPIGRDHRPWRGRRALQHVQQHGAHRFAHVVADRTDVRGEIDRLQVAYSQTQFALIGHGRVANVADLILGTLIGGVNDHLIRFVPVVHRFWIPFDQTDQRGLLAGVGRYFRFRYVDQRWN